MSKRPLHVLSRRELLKWMGMGAASLAFPGCTSWFQSGDPAWWADVILPDLPADDCGPVNRSLSEDPVTTWLGDDPERAHKILWDKQAYLKAQNYVVPPPSEKAKVVVIGGGLSGLLCTYLLRDYQPILLEQSDRFGGNSKGESWSGLDYSTGAAYFSVPEAGSLVDNLFQELNLANQFKTRIAHDPVISKGVTYPRFWEGESQTEFRQQFLRFEYYLKSLHEGLAGGVYPEIPTHDSKMRAYVDQLDARSFGEHLESKMGGPLCSHLRSAIELYCWSAFSASQREVSAAAALNFLVGERNGLAMFPGGNAAITERLWRKIYGSVPETNLRSNSLVFTIEPKGDKVLVAYDNREGLIKTIEADTVIFAGPKFMLPRLIDGLERHRLAAIKKMKYRSYLVYNVWLQEKIDPNFYDLFLLGNGDFGLDDIEKASHEVGVTDLVLANFASPNPERTVLTLYRPMPFDSGRARVFEEDAYAKYSTELETALYSQILPLFNLPADAVRNIRYTRWGHPLPVAQPRLYLDRETDELQKPHKDRVFFVNQDNWALPAMETVVHEAYHWSEIVKKKLDNKA